MFDFFTELFFPRSTNRNRPVVENPMYETSRRSQNRLDIFMEIFAGDFDKINEEISSDARSFRNFMRALKNARDRGATEIEVTINGDKFSLYLAPPAPAADPNDDYVEVIDKAYVKRLVERHLVSLTTLGGGNYELMRTLNDKLDLGIPQL